MNFPAEIPDLDLALQTLAFHNGSARKAAEELAERGKSIPRSTLDRWKRKHKEEYHEARRAMANHKWELASDGWSQRILEAQDAARQFTVEALRYKDAGEANKASQMMRAAKDAATVGGISNDKAAIIDQRPTTPPTEQADLPSLVRRLATEFSGVVKIAPELIESTATEIEESK